MYLIALNKVVAVVDVIKISLVQTFYNTFLRLTPFSFNVREQSKSFTCSGVFVREVISSIIFFFFGSLALNRNDHDFVLLCVVSLPSGKI